MGCLGNIFSVKFGTILSHFLRGAVWKMYSKPISCHLYVLINIIILFSWMHDPQVVYPVKKPPKLRDTPGCLNEGKSHFTFQSICTSKSGYYMMVFLRL